MRSLGADEARPATWIIFHALTATQVVDYRANAPLPAYLARAYAAQPFDYVFDTIGTQALFDECAAYLAQTGLLVNVGNFEGFGVTIWRAVVNTYLPRMFGGVPRREGGRARAHGRGAAFAVDDVFEFEDALKAYDGCLRGMQWGKLSSRRNVMYLYSILPNELALDLAPPRLRRDGGAADIPATEHSRANNGRLIRRWDAAKNVRARSSSAGALKHKPRAPKGPKTSKPSRCAMQRVAGESKPIEQSTRR
ncbi:hypothetical protein GGX14DRAFT_651787 [Mycena pura]|uniref:Uncharacterized protein n=1 Tax=Mycena pura TaxID=153505 RepID=A0AAD6YD99_9AGAR|nr:hypothetical protein GGX14DRAFT_651787 [Mycena pura]